MLRLRDEAVVNVEEELPVSPGDMAAGVTRQAWVRLGARPSWQSPRVRVVWIQTAQGETLRLVTNVAPEALNAAEVGLLYRRRWQIECFFKWVKCLLGCRHWLAESQRGVTLQLYLALIASVLLQLATGRRPNRRMLGTPPALPIGLGDTGGTAGGPGARAGQSAAPEQKSELRNPRATAKPGARRRSHVQEGRSPASGITPSKHPHRHLRIAPARELPSALPVPNTTGWKPCPTAWVRLRNSS